MAKKDLQIIIKFTNEYSMYCSDCDSEIEIGEVEEQRDLFPEHPSYERFVPVCPRCGSSACLSSLD